MAAPLSGGKPERKFYLDLNAVARPLRVVFFEAVSFVGSIGIIWALAKIPVCKKYLFLIKG